MVLSMMGFLDQWILREYLELNDLWDENKAPWKVFEKE